MACILKAPSQHSKGVVTFTTQERDHVILKDESLADQIEDLKHDWLIGLHHNWHDYHFRYNPLFDFSMAGEDDLREVNNAKFRLLEMDACNFSPTCFSPGETEKFWDILYLARAVTFKNIPEFIEIIRHLYDAGMRCRVLLICAVPPDKEGADADARYRALYNELFDDIEKRHFTLLTLNFSYPYPFDLETLAHFYRASKIFVHSANDERRCRVAAYAWASGMPVVAKQSVGSILPFSVQKPPYFYQAKRYSHFPQLIQEALANYDHQPLPGENPARDWTSVTTMSERLKGRLKEWCGDDRDDRFALTNLDIRLGRHHGISVGANKISWNLQTFLQYLTQRDHAEICQDIQSDDPEVSITSLTGFEGTILSRNVEPETKKKAYYGIKRRIRQTINLWLD